MAHIAADRVQELTTTTGTGAFALGGAVSGHRAFSAVLAEADTCFYAAVHQTAGEWEVGVGTRSGSTLVRSIVLSSSNANAAVNFSAGTKNVFITVPAIGFVPRSPEGAALILPASGTVPTPSTGLAAYPAADLPRELALKDASGGVRAVQTNFRTHRVDIVTPSFSPTSPAAPNWTGLRGVFGTASGSVVLPNPVLTGAFYASMPRFTLDMASGTPAYVRDGQLTYSRRQGFLYYARFAIPQALASDVRLIIGMTSATIYNLTASNVIGIISEPTDSNLFFWYRTASTDRARVDLGVAKATVAAYDLLIDMPEGGSTFRVVVRRLDDANTVSVLLDTSYDATLLSETQLLGRNAQVANATTINYLDIMRIYTESRW